jgi:hypothetical protein
MMIVRIADGYRCTIGMHKELKLKINYTRREEKAHNVNSINNYNIQLQQLKMLTTVLAVTA